jgi:GDP-L-fucose synthase
MTENAPSDLRNLYRGARVLVTGGRGFLGGALCRALIAAGATPIPTGRAEADLRDRKATFDLLHDLRPDVVIHAAVDGGGIGWMKDHPVESGLHNVLINCHLIEASHAVGVRTFIGVGSACAYPRLCPVPFLESDLWNGYPEPTNGPYAQSKRVLIDLSAAYHAQHGMQALCPMLANLYGPGDHLEPGRAHVAAALLQRVARLPPGEPLLVWGSGRPTREFIHVDDAAEGILSMARIHDPRPVNIGTGREVSIAELARLILDVAGHTGELLFDPSQPDGQPRKCLSVDLARELLGWQARIPLDQGLAQTLAWYRDALGANP